MAKRDLDEFIPINLNGNAYAVNPNVIGSKELNVNIPEVVVRGTKPEHRYYKSAFDPTAVWDAPHKGLEVLGKGMSYITPEWMEKAMPYLSPSQYVGMIQGKGLPGTETNDGFGSSKQDQYLNELFDLVASKAPATKMSLKTGKWGYGVAKNIKNRNQHAYATISPYGYDHPFVRFKDYAKSILSGEPNYAYLGKSPHIAPNVTGYVYGSYGNPQAAQMVASISRDEAFRKYLGLPSLLEMRGQEPVYVPNTNGSFAYNMAHLNKIAKKNKGSILPYLMDSKDGVRVYDWITGAGGGVNQRLYTLGNGIGKDRFNTYGVGVMRDRWDLHPFRDAATGESKLPRLYKEAVAKSANYVYNKLYDNLYSSWTGLGKLTNGKGSKFAYKHLGGSYLNRLRYGDAKFPGIIQDANGSYVIAPRLNKLFDKLSDIEVGKILGGKPFDLEQEFKYTKLFDPDNQNITTNKYGWVNEEINPFTGTDLEKARRANNK